MANHYYNYLVLGVVKQVMGVVMGVVVLEPSLYKIPYLVRN